MIQKYNLQNKLNYYKYLRDAKKERIGDRKWGAEKEETSLCTSTDRYDGMCIMKERKLPDLDVIDSQVK